MWWQIESRRLLSSKCREGRRAVLNVTRPKCQKRLRPCSWPAGVRRPHRGQPGSCRCGAQLLLIIVLNRTKPATSVRTAVTFQLRIIHRIAIRLSSGYVEEARGGRSPDVHKQSPLRSLWPCVPTLPMSGEYHSQPVAGEIVVPQFAVRKSGRRDTDVVRVVMLYDV